MRSAQAEVVPDLIPALEFSPEEALTCVAAAAHQACLGPEGQERHPNLHPYVKETRVTVWLFNHPDASLPFRGVKSSTIGAGRPSVVFVVPIACFEDDPPANAPASFDACLHSTYRSLPSGRLVSVRGTVR